MKYFGIAICIAASLFLAWQIFMLIKTNNTFKNRIIIIDAIYAYVLWCVKNNADIEVDYTDMETYDETDNRYFDWGYTNILPQEKFELIKPYIKEGKK